MRYRDRLKQMILIVSVILLVLIIGLTFGGREQVSRFENLLGNVFIPIQRVFDMAADGMKAVVNPIFDIWENEARVQELEAEKEALEAQLVERTLEATEYAELKMLQNVYDFTTQDLREDMVAARVVAKDPGNWYNMFMIDRGLADGVVKNATVINGQGLVGLAYEVGEDWSKVISIIDNKSAIGFKVLDDTRDFEGVVNGGIDGRLSGTLFDPQADIWVGDLLITSGKGLYPEGVIIGAVESVTRDEDALLLEIGVTPRVDFRQLDRVLVVAQEAGE